MPQIQPTHINALYDDLADTQQVAAIALGKVELLKEQIRARGGVVPGEEQPESTTSPTVTEPIQETVAEFDEANRKGRK